LSVCLFSVFTLPFFGHSLLSLNEHNPFL
jgi:hypothetical protein